MPDCLTCHDSRVVETNRAVVVLCDRDRVVVATFPRRVRLELETAERADGCPPEEAA